ncbi:MAG: hypothetical protein ACOC87_01155 [Candidatus Natronoplasma sp.]
MQEIYLWMLLSIALGGAGFFIAFSKAMKERKSILTSLPSETTESILEGKETLREVLSRYTMVYSILTIPAFLYTILVPILVYIFGVHSDAQVRVAMGAFIAVGLSSFFTNLGRSFIFEEAMTGLNDNEGGSKNDFGRYNVLLVVFETLAIYGLLISVLGLNLAGITGLEVDLEMRAADMYFYGAVVMGLSTSCSILMGWLFNKVEGPVNEDIQLFIKKVTYLSAGHLPSLIGFIIAIYLIIEGGMVG